MIDGEGVPESRQPGSWVVPAPSIGDNGRPVRRRAVYPASSPTPSTGQASPPDRKPGDRIAPDDEATSSDDITSADDGAAKRDAVANGSEGRTMGQRIRSWTETLAVFAVGLVLALVVRAFVLQAFSIPSDSMVPTLEQGDRVVVWKPSDTIADLNRGDVIVFKRPNVAECPFADDDPADLIKRVIGLPGEEVTSPEGEVLVDGKAIDESYLPAGTRTDMAEPIDVPEGRVLMLGDNRGASKDGRCFGPIDEDAIVGRATARVWPPGRIGGL